LSSTSKNHVDLWQNNQKTYCLCQLRDLQTRTI